MSGDRHFVKFDKVHNSKSVYKKAKRQKQRDNVCVSLARAFVIYIIYILHATFNTPHIKILLISVDVENYYILHFFDFCFSDIQVSP